MNQADPQASLSAAPRKRAAAFSVHVFTALGAGVALLALLEAVREHWSAMFAWLGVALVIDAIDGPMARRLDVVRLQPSWSGDMLDLVVDFMTYVFVPAYAVTAGGLMLPLAAPLRGIGVTVSGALYFADRRMKTPDNHFRGFPGLWNIVVFYLFLLRWPPALSRLLVASCSWRRSCRSMSFIPSAGAAAVADADPEAAWGVLGLYALIEDFNVEAPSPPRYV